MKAKTKKNAFTDAADVLGTGIDALFAQGDDPEFMVNLDDVEVVEQVREVMEDDEQDLMSLGESLAKYQIQPILLRIMPPDHAKPYRLVAGERRLRAAQLKGLSQLRARARELTDEEAEDLQFAENIHRKNLTQIEEAKRIQRDLDALGSVEAVLAKHHKSRAWLSKMLGLLNLPEQTKRLVSENVSADVEVINSVKIIEQADPDAAQALVEELKSTRGKGRAREKVQAVKEQVKPKKKAKRAPDLLDEPSAVATPRNHQHEEPGPVVSRPNADAVLQGLYVSICEKGQRADEALDALGNEAYDAACEQVYSFFMYGESESNALVGSSLARMVFEGLRKGEFAREGAGAFALAAFLTGASGQEWDFVAVLNSVTP